VFIRESSAECVLVLAARAAGDVVVALEGEPQPLFGGLAIAAGRIVVDGPAFAAWSLPGVAVPA
jgi:alpha-glucosidase